MLLFRLQHKTLKVGPYQMLNYDYECTPWLDNVWRDIADKHVDCSKHPSPKQEGLPLLRFQHHCAFQSIAKLFEWFDEPLLELLNNNFVVVKLIANKVVAGERQVIYDKDFVSSECVLTKREVLVLFKSWKEYHEQAQCL